MAVTVTHQFVSPVADAGDPNEVGPNEWNDTHTITGLGTAAEADSADFATAAQGALADTAVQPAAIANMLETSDIGVSVQGYDADLAAWAGVNPSSYSTTAQIAAAYQPLDADLTAWAGVNPSSYSTTAQIAAAYQPLDASLTAYAALVTAADKAVYYSGADVPATYDISAYGRTLAGLADETALEALLDTLPNLTSIQGRTVTLADAGADALLGWDDSASAYQNLSAADAIAALGITSTATELNYTDGVTSAIQTQLDGKQAADADLTTLATAFTAASASGPASLDFAEDTDNGTNRVRLIAPTSVASDKTVTLPDVTGTLLVGALGSTDNAILRADGTAGATAQGSSATLSDGGNLTLSTTTQFEPQVQVNAEYNGTSAGYINFQKGRASGPVQSGDDVGTFVGQARDSASALKNVGFFSFVVTAAPAAGSVDGKINFSTTQSGTTATRMAVQLGVLLAAATGGDKGAGTLNATEVYNDNVALTCMALQDEFLKRGAVDIEKWDALVPDLVVPERRESVPRTYTLTETKPVEVTKEEGGRLVRRVVVQAVEREVPMIWAEPVYDDKGAIVDAVETPLFDEVVTPEQVIPRVHGTARMFADMLAEGFDPRDPAQYIAKLKTDQALPGMPSLASWQHNEVGSGEMFMRLWLASEMMSLVIMNMHGRLAALEAVRPLSRT